MARNIYSRSERNSLSEHDIFFDMLMTEKYMSHLYDHAVLESTGDLVRDTFQTLQHTTQTNAQRLFETMQQQGWYSVNKRQTQRNTSSSRLSSRKAFSPDMRQSQVNPGLNGTHRGKSGIATNSPRYVEHYNTPQ